MSSMSRCRLSTTAATCTPFSSFDWFFFISWQNSLFKKSNSLKGVCQENFEMMRIRFCDYFFTTHFKFVIATQGTVNLDSPVCGQHRVRILNFDETWVGLTLGFLSNNILENCMRNEFHISRKNTPCFGNFVFRTVSCFPNLKKYETANPIWVESTPYLSRSVDHAELCRGISLLKVCIILLWKSLLGHHQGPQPLPRHVVHLLVQPVVVLHCTWNTVQVNIQWLPQDFTVRWKAPMGTLPTILYV